MTQLYNVYVMNVLKKKWIEENSLKSYTLFFSKYDKINYFFFNS